MAHRRRMCPLTRPTAPSRAPIRRDNTFGTPEQDAFRRDFTINALFYDIATFAIIDYVNGMKDLRRRLIRCIGDPGERFIEDPVRMMRAVTFGIRLGFRLDAPVREAIASHHGEIAQASPARLLEELYKILRSGLATKTFRALSRRGLMQHLAPEVERCRNSRRLWRSLDALDAYRAGFDAAPGASVERDPARQPVGAGAGRRPRATAAGGPDAAPLPGESAGAAAGHRAPSPSPDAAGEARGSRPSGPGRRAASSRGTAFPTR